MKAKPSNHSHKIVNLFLEGKSIEWIVGKENSTKAKVEQLIRKAFVVQRQEIIEERNYISGNY